MSGYRIFMGDWFFNIIELSAGNPAMIIAAVAMATFISEDATTVGAALLAAQGVIPIPEALIGLFMGITMGDLSLFAFGDLARRWKWMAHRIGEERIARGQKWLDKRLIPAFFLARVTPGLRVPSYIASGYLGVSLARFMILAIIAVGLWTAVAFTVVYTFGNISQTWFGSYSWIVGIILVIFVLTTPIVFRKAKPA